MRRLLGLGLLLILGLTLRADDPPLRTLPGMKAGGTTLLPNGWSLKPVGRQFPLGDFPVNLALHPGGQWLAVLHAGYGDHEIIIVDLNKQKKVCRVILDQTFYGLCFSPDGKQLFASGGEYEVVHAFDFDEGLLSNHRQIKIVEPKEKFIPGGLAVDPKGKTVAVAGPWGDAVAFATPKDALLLYKVGLEAESFPYGCLFDKNGKRLFVSLWNKSAVAVIDPGSGKWPRPGRPKRIRPRWPCHPTARRCYVACANSTKVSVLDTADGKGLETISCSLYPAAPVGQHAQQPEPDARRQDAVRRQRRRQQPRRLQRRRAAARPSRSASSRSAGIRPRCATTRRTSGSTSPTARVTVVVGQSRRDRNRACRGKTTVSSTSPA